MDITGVVSFAVMAIMVVVAGYMAWKCFDDSMNGRPITDTLINGGMTVGLVVVIGGIAQLVAHVFSSSFEGSDTAETSTTPSPTPEPTTEVPTPDSSGTNVDYGSIGLVILIIVGVVALCVALGFLLRAALRGVKKRKITKGNENAARVSWKDLDDRVGVILAKYAQAESDPRTAVFAPMVTKMKYQLTRDFHAAKRECTSFFDGVTKIDRSSEDKLDKATGLVRQMEDSWHTLWARAVAVGIPGITDKQNDRAHDLIDAYMDESRTEGERDASLNLLVKILQESEMDRQEVEDTREFIRSKVALALSGRNQKALMA